MGVAINEPDIDGTAGLASANVICEEFLKVLSRKEVEQPMIWHVTYSRDPSPPPRPPSE